MKLYMIDYGWAGVQLTLAETDAEARAAFEAHDRKHPPMPPCGPVWEPSNGRSIQAFDIVPGQVIVSEGDG